MSDLRVVPLRADGPDTQTVAILEDLLVRAHAGDIVGVAVAYRSKDNNVGTVFSAVHANLMAGTSWLAHRLNKMFEEEV